MRSDLQDGRLQITAALSLLKFSGLVSWDRNSKSLVAVSQELFESRWQSKIDPAFGRFICWINFSAGAELLAKGVCLLHGVEILPTILRPDPSGGMLETKRNFGTLKNVPAAIRKLCKKVGAQPEEQSLLLSAYKGTLTRIRNRDVHSYTPNVRDADYCLVPDLFARCFNLLVSWLPPDGDGASTLNDWIDGAATFIAQLKPE